jgi:predicted O-methyltransferase YrrM
MLKNRLELAKYFAKLGFKKGAEIGVCSGHYSEILCQNIPGLKLFAIDNWNNPRNTRRENQLGSLESITKKKLAPYKATIIKKDSQAAAKKFVDESLDFVYIDADHTYESVKNDIHAWVKKVRKGGIVAGHDYYVFRSGNRGVIDAVNEYVKEHKIKLSTTNWDKENPLRDDRQPSWFFVKA